MTMKSFRISCYILFLFPFILEDAAVTVYYCCCSWAHVTNDASYFVNYILISSFKRQHKSGLNCPHLSAIVYILRITNYITQHTTYNIQHTSTDHQLVGVMHVV